MEKLKSQHIFQISHKSDTDELLEGTFTTKRLSIRDRSRIGMRKSQLAGGMYCVRDDIGNPTGQGLDVETDWINSMIAHLETSLVQKPVWFDLEEIADLELIRKVYEEVAQFESSFFRPEPAELDPGGSADNGAVRTAGSSPEYSQTGVGNNPTPVVGPEVQAALDA